MSTNASRASYPKCVLVFSGKRKSGKDYLSGYLLEKFQEEFGKELCLVLRLSGPLKKQYALENGLNYEELLNASTYKETFRAKMITWGEDKRAEDPYFFCRATVADAQPEKYIWIITDARRKTDIQFFRENYPESSKFIRITAQESVREERGFIFTPGIDDAESECGLDDKQDWDFTVVNDGDSRVFEQAVQGIVTYIKSITPQSR